MINLRKAYSVFQGRINAVVLWLRVLSFAWISTGVAFFTQRVDTPDASLVPLTMWSLTFIAGGILAGRLSFRLQSGRLYAWTAGLVSTAPFARAIYVAVYGNNLVFASRVIAFVIWMFFGVTLALRWRDLVPVPVTIRVLSIEGK